MARASTALGSSENCGFRSRAEIWRLHQHGSGIIFRTIPASCSFLLSLLLASSICQHGFGIVRYNRLWNSLPRTNRKPSRATSPHGACDIHERNSVPAIQLSSTSTSLYFQGHRARCHTTCHIVHSSCYSSGSTVGGEFSPIDTHPVPNLSRPIRWSSDSTKAARWQHQHVQSHFRIVCANGHTATSSARGAALTSTYTGSTRQGAPSSCRRDQSRTTSGGE